MVASPSDTADTLIAGSQNLQDPPGAMVAPLHDDALELPGYLTNASPQRSADRTEHTYSLENSKARKWLVLTVKSRAANATSLPTYYEKDIISGRVELDLDTPETIKGIFVTVKGVIIVVGQNEESFLNINHDIWNPALGHPTDDKASPSKLKGRFSWPFSIHLPSATSVKDGKGSKNFSLPPSFSERASTAYIDYKIAVTIKRSALKINQILTTNFGYIPITKPDPPSTILRLAYEQGTSLVGPDGDPNGWSVLPTYKFVGKLFDTRKAEVQCTLAIAMPLSYALNSPLPVILTLRSTDPQALDLLAAHSAIRLHLVRSLTLGSSATNEIATARSKGSFKASSGRAAFWPSTEGAKQDGVRVLQGEIDVKSSVKPTFVFPKFAIRYSLDLLPFEAPGFTYTGQPSDVLLSQPVVIASTAVPGVVPRFFAPPGYAQPEAADYSNTVGMLENGNQLFYQHHATGTA